MIRPLCPFCQQNGETCEATLLAAQSIDRGATVRWVPICAGHADGWNEGGDWEAPMFVLVESNAYQQLAEKMR